MIHRYAVLDSTNSEARRLVAAGVPCQAVVADAQTQGRGCGEFARWHSPVGNLYASYLVSDTHKGQELALRAAVAVGRVLPKVSFKYPNDLYCGEGKVGGILIEAEAPFWIIGCGINVTSSPLLTAYPAANLRESGVLIGAAELFEQIRMSLPQALEDEFAEICRQWNARCRHINRFVTLRDGRSGIFKGVSAQGKAILVG